MRLISSETNKGYDLVDSGLMNCLLCKEPITQGPLMFCPTANKPLCNQCDPIAEQIAKDRSIRDNPNIPRGLFQTMILNKVREDLNTTFNCGCKFLQANDAHSTVLESPCHWRVNHIQFKEGILGEARIISLINAQHQEMAESFVDQEHTPKHLNTSSTSSLYG